MPKKILRLPTRKGPPPRQQNLCAPAAGLSRARARLESRGPRAFGIPAPGGLAALMLAAALPVGLVELAALVSVRSLVCRRSAGAGVPAGGAGLLAAVGSRRSAIRPPSPRSTLRHDSRHGTAAGVFTAPGVISW